MKILIASDIHGSSYYAEKLVNKFKEEKADKIILLGDIYNHGPRNPLPKEYAPMKVAEILNSVKDNLIVVKGNCDSEVDTLISEFDFLENTTLVIDNKTLFLTHGDKYNKDQSTKTVFNAVIYGHFHTLFIEKKGNTMYINSGSVALPKDDNHSYLILDNTKISAFDIDSGREIFESKI